MPFAQIRELRRAARGFLAHAGHADAPEQLRQHLVCLFAAGTLTSGAFVQLAWLITRAGGSGIADLGHDPETIGRNAARLLKSRLGMNGIAKNLLLDLVVPQRHGRGKLAAMLPLAMLPAY